MSQLKVEKAYCGEIPLYIVYPIRETKRSVIFYHGWSSEAKCQLSRAYLLAVQGYTVYLPDAVCHGERDRLEDYYTMKAYPVFWKTIIQNIKEFPTLYSYIKNEGKDQPFLMGHSMGGMSVMGIAAAYPDLSKGIVSFNGSGDWLLTHVFLQARFGVYMGENRDFCTMLKEFSPIIQAEKMAKLPMLLTNGESDESIDLRAQEHFFESMKKYNSSIQRITYPKLGHFVTTNMMDDAISWMESVR